MRRRDQAVLGVVGLLGLGALLLGRRDEPDEPYPGPRRPPGPGQPGAAPPPPPLTIDDLGIVSDAPRGGALYRVRRGDRFLGDGGIVATVLREQAELAGHPNPSAVASNGRNRIRYLDLLQCSGYNDLLYGTWQYGRNARPGPHGRAITLRPIHANNLVRLRAGEPAIRNITMGSPDDAGNGRARAIDRAYAEGYETLWLPPLEPAALLAGRITSEGLVWPDGSSRSWPPPQVLGDVAAVVDPGLGEYGCELGVLRW